MNPSPIFSDEEILLAADTVSIGENGKPCFFKSAQVQQELFKQLPGTGVINGSCGRYERVKQFITGAKVSAVLRSYPDRFTAILNNGRVKNFCRAGSEIIRYG